MKPLSGLDALLHEQVRYYRAVAAEYEEHALPHSGAAELIEALDAFRPAGSVLELACGQGTWTARLLRSATIQRRLNDGTAYRIVKVPYRPADLERDLERLGWSITVHPTSGPFFWGAGGRAYRLVPANR